MKPIQNQYRDLLEGKMTKDNFMRNVRMQFPDFISATNSYQDAVSILKSKRILTEEMNKAEKKPFYLVDETGEILDSTMAFDVHEATKYFANEYGGVGTTLTVIHTENPDALASLYEGSAKNQWDSMDPDTRVELTMKYVKDPDEAEEIAMRQWDNLPDDVAANIGRHMDAKVGGPEAAIDALRAGVMREDTLEAAKKRAMQISKEEGVVQHVEDKGNGSYEVSDWYDADKTVASYEHGRQINEAHPGGQKYSTIDVEVHGFTHVFAYPDSSGNETEEGLNGWESKDSANREVHFVKNSKEAQSHAKSFRLHEAAEKSEGAWKQATGKDEYSIFAEIDRVNPYEFKKGIDIEMGMQYKAVPNYFSKDFNPEVLAKATKKVLENLKKHPAFYTNKISAPTEERTNMPQFPKEQKTGPDGHIKMKGQKKEDSNTQDNLGNKEKAKGKPQGVKEMKPTKNVKGFASNKANSKLPKGVELMKEEFGRLGGVNLGSSFEKMKGGDKEAQLHDLMKKYDWYHEMSDDYRAQERGRNLDKQIRALGREIGVDKAIEIFNQYAPEGRKATPLFFQIQEDKLAKLKEYLKKTLTKELAVLTNPKTGESVSTTSPAGTALAKKMGYSREEPGGKDIQHLGEK